jgi:hypothetical protein
MLHKLTVMKLEWILLLLMGLLMASGCKSNTSSQSAETDAYLADYESPENGKWGFIDSSGTLVIEPVFDDVTSFSEGLAAVNQKGKWGYVDRTGKAIIPLVYKSAWAFHEKKARVRPFDNPDCFVDATGAVLSSAEWSAAGDFSEGLALVRIGNTFGYIDSTGILKIQAVYSRGHIFQHGLAVIEAEEKTGVINVKGEQIIPARFDHITIYEEEQIILCRDSQVSSAYDLSGNELVRLENSIMLNTDGKLISLLKEDTACFYDIAAKRLRQAGNFRNIIYLGEQRWAGKLEHGYYLLNNDGIKMTARTYSQINHFKDGLAVYGKGKDWGYMDLNGNERTRNDFILAWDYKEKFARAAFEQGIAFIDNQQMIAFYPPIGTLDLRDFSEGLAPVLVSN